MRRKDTKNGTIIKNIAKFAPIKKQSSWI